MGATAEAATEVGRRSIIERPRLTRLLDETSARVIMLVAPAGYGKTTLARQWLEDRPHGWYQGGVGSSDVAAVALGLAEAAETLLPGVGRRLREWLPTSRGPEDEVDIIERFLSEGLADWPDEAWFVIDDYQFLSSFASEDLVRRLFATGQRRLLLTSRQRPSWASARELLYGNVFELAQSSLAMNVEEANEVLSPASPEAAGGLVALADGWPAVIGLAALMPNKITVEAGLPEELHDYFAEELFASLPEETRNDLCRLALLRVASRDGAEAVLGARARTVVAAAREAGMFIPQQGPTPTFHPLLRAFLGQKLHELGPKAVSDTVRRAVEFLAAEESWDESFALISTFERTDLLDYVLARAIVPLTLQGRLATLREWLEFARAHRVSSPCRNLLEAELALRQGLHERGGYLARAAASSFARDDALLSLALYRAGQSRHFMDDARDSLRYFKEAHETARTTADARNALWGQFLVAQELESAEGFHLLQKLESLGDSDSDAAARNMCGRLILTMLYGPILPPEPALSSAQSAVEEANDPLVRSALSRVLTGLLVLEGEYALALRAADRMLEDAERFHLDFVRPHTLVSKTAANIGLRRFGAARRMLEEIEAASLKMNDPYLAVNAEMLRCRLLLSEGSPETATTAFTATASRESAPARRMEFEVTRAAAIACAGDPERAIELLNEVRDVSSSLEPQLLLKWIQSMCLLLTGHPEARENVRQSYLETASSRAWDAFVFTYRASAGVLEMVAEDESCHSELAGVMSRSNDHRLARRHGVASNRLRAARPAVLTLRELDVYSLLAEGLSNREIARALVISEATAKVHVRHILRKLGMRSRTEVAIQAARTQPPQGPFESEPLASR